MVQPGIHGRDGYFSPPNSGATVASGKRRLIIHQQWKIFQGCLVGLATKASRTTRMVIYGLLRTLVVQQVLSTRTHGNPIALSIASYPIIEPTSRKEANCRPCS